MKGDNFSLPSHVLTKVFESEFDEFCLTQEYKFHDERKWRFDYAFIDQKVAIEINGGTYICGRHNRAGSVLKDYEKLNHAASNGWLVFQFIPQNAHLSTNLELVKKALYSRK